jgi:Domain of unknown function (DUF4279)
MTKSDVLPPATFATLRFAGDELDPAEISAILPIKPKRAHRKGEEFFAGQRAGKLSGGTGIWYFDTRGLESHDLADHLRVIEQLLYPAPTENRRVMKLRDVLTRSHGRAHVSCFWHGSPGDKPPMIPPQFERVAREIDADIETDFTAG